MIVLFGFYGFFVANSNSDGGNLEKELPLNSIQGVIVNESGIYIGLGYYSRIQKYNHEGNYIKAWETKTYSKDYAFKIKNGTPEISSRNVSKNQVDWMLESEHVDDKTRKLLLETGDFKQILNPLTFTDDKGVLYMIEGSFSKKLVKIQNGEKTVIIKQSIMLNLFNGYSRPWFYGVIGILLFTLLNVNIITQNFSNRNGISSFINLFKDVFK